MQTHLARLVASLHEAAGRRKDAPPQLESVLAVLAADYPPAAARGQAVDPRLQQVVDVFGLTSFDADLLVAAAGPDFDANIGAAYSLLLGDPARQRVSLGLALELGGAGPLSPLARARLGPTAPLVRGGLVTVEGAAPLLSRPLRVPDRVTAHLLGDDTLDPATAAVSTLPSPLDLPGAELLANAIIGGARFCYVRSAPGAAGAALAAGAFERASISQLAVDLGRRAAPRDAAAVVAAVVRDAALLARGLVVTGVDALVEHDPASLSLLATAPVPVIAVGAGAWNVEWLLDPPVVVEAPALDRVGRAALWRAMAPDALDADDEAQDDLIGLRLSPEEITWAARAAAAEAAAARRPLDVATLRTAARRRGGGPEPGRRRATARAGFSDLVLPGPTLGALRELVSWARHRDEVFSHGSVAGKGTKGKGIAALFSGSPGTGKTLAAEAIAGELGLDLHIVELSAVVDKYIGETEKNLERVFRDAESLNVVLFFDEADALFGFRSEVRDARDRYANQGVSYLLQRMEAFDGIAVLATNLRGNLDAAFLRRLHFIVHFPDPDAATRRRLWEAHLESVPVLDPDDPIDVPSLAETVELVGGDIRNIVLAAVFSATADHQPLGMGHVVKAINREYRKLGRRIPREGFAKTHPE